MAEKLGMKKQEICLRPYWRISSITRKQCEKYKNKPSIINVRRKRSEIWQEVNNWLLQDAGSSSVFTSDLLCEKGNYQIRLSFQFTWLGFLWFLAIFKLKSCVEGTEIFYYPTEWEIGTHDYSGNNSVIKSQPRCKRGEGSLHTYILKIYSGKKIVTPRRC